jgi:hypothetical protein
MKKVMKKISGLFGILAFIAIFGLYIFTTIFAYKESGLIASIISAFTPVVSSFFWFFATWYKYGISNPYIHEVTISIAWFGAFFTLSIISSALSE